MSVRNLAAGMSVSLAKFLKFLIELRSVVWMKYKIKDKEVFDKAYSYIEQYY